jgi:hypothetical protein
VAVSVFKIDVGPLSGPGWVRFPCTPATCFRARLSHNAAHVISSVLRNSLTILIAVATVASAQDTATVVATPDSLRPPISPKRAFLTSLFAPGASQNRLGRNRVAAGFIAVEAMSIAMIRESGADVRQAKRQLGDSLVLSYVDASGNKTAPTLERRRFGDDEVSSRRSHVEDWIALLVANHLFAASEAFVAASLWDVNARVTLGGDRGNLLVGARLGW